MRIAYYMPFKPLGHANPSGDLVIGSELFQMLKQCGHEVTLISRLRARWIYWKPWQMATLPFHLTSAAKKARQMNADVWLSYHSYYKAPDLLGPLCARYLNIPYAIFQGIYATKYRRSWTTLPGFWLNRRALLAADLVFSNKFRDHFNLKRIVASDRLVHVAPGLRTEMFFPCKKARSELRRSWGVDNTPVVISAAMFRPGVKTRGIAQVIDACARLQQNGIDFRLVIIGDGQSRRELKQLAREKVPHRHRFLGKIPRNQLFRYFSAADLFVFPGIEESLGMVYLEAQACGLPVVALEKWGAKEAVVADQTGILVKQTGVARLADAIAALLDDPNRRKNMGSAARQHIIRHHDVIQNYGRMISALENLGKHHP